MNIDLSRFKVVYDEKVYNALALLEIELNDYVNYEEIHKKPKFIEIMIINEDGNIAMIRDEAWRFQFIPIVNSSR